MSIIVQKFGGTSVATSQKILAAARKAIRAKQQGNQVVMVVSAMGKNTDLLVDLSNEITDRPAAREMDMLLSTGEQVSAALMAMSIHSLGHKAISLTGAQIGIRTDSTHTKARIQSISTDRIQNLLDEGNIVIAAGFQGIDEEFNITTLGRGGSDTTAVALAAVLKEASCEIYTDVDGIYTTDPRLAPEARKVSRVSYDEMLELASLGASVMHNRAVEFAKKFSVPIHVRGSFTDTPGTMITHAPESLDRAVTGAALVKKEARITLHGVPDSPGTSHSLFAAVAGRNVTVDMIVQDVGSDGVADISFTVPENELQTTLEAVQEIATRLKARAVTHDADVSKVSVVGLGMASQTGVAETMFQSLAQARINLLMITTSEIKISTLVSREQGIEALRITHHVFELGNDPELLTSNAELSKYERASAADIVDCLQQMEELTVDEITLDQSQARVTIRGVPDVPGVAKQVFHEVARGNIFVDMIVQSIGSDSLASLSFTIPKKSLADTLDICDRLVKELNCSTVEHSPKVAKLSVSGIGLRSHTGVAIRTFQALSQGGINIEMLSTSEVRVNVVVDGARGDEALDRLTDIFADAIR